MKLSHVPSAANIADPASRSLSLADAKLSADIWSQIQTAFGGNTDHTVDLMTLPSNVMHDSSGKPLSFFSPHPTPGCLGVNIFSQLPHRHPLHVFANPYVFPPICLIPNILRFLRNITVAFSIVVPDVQPRRFWWPILTNIASASFCFGRKGQTGIVLPPSRRGFNSKWPLPWDIWALRVHCSLSV